MNIDNLIKEIERYYDLGFPTMPNGSPSQFDDIFKITEAKINRLLTDNLSFTERKLISDIEKEFKEFNVLSEFEKQFPNYSISIQLHEKDIEELTIIYSLELRLSLLTQYFTAFYEERIIHKNSSLHLHTFTPITTSIRSSKTRVANYQEKYMDTIKRIVTVLFPNYSFLSHHLLCKTIITNGVPLGLDPSLSNNGFSVYNFLFDNDFDYLGTTYITM
ncbi:hypothetical protein [Pedobacter xixiisoli]|uniref:Uncharacterized protein n=1 Tax=Pedobacter xixiisoli TaxID=1476464 RepID=A0A286A0I3_9SPHI|nr:hypothetical protein [Pedobacter xixiisoli]SOD15414.1 hypothetical protein SAMN06297358_2408 [Pedobacter xixiisoli]